MAWAGDQRNSGFVQPIAIGPVVQVVPVAANPVPGTIAASGTFDAGLMPADGYKALAVGATLSQAGTLSVHRYLDRDGRVPQVAPNVAALEPGAPAVLNLIDGKPFASFAVQIVNNGTVAASLTNFAILMNAN